ncbi:lipid A export permease/ATP-binding protein MsbA [soil metagenome]
MIDDRVPADGRVIYGRLLEYLKPYKRAFAIAVFCMVGSALTEISFAKFMEVLIDRGFTGRGDYVWKGPAVLIGIIVFRASFQFGSSYLLSYIANRVQVDLRAEMFARLIRLPVPFFDKHASAGIITKLTADVNNIGQASGHALTVLVRDSLSSIGLLSYLLWLNWKLTGIAIVIMPVVVFSTGYLGRRLRDMSWRSQVATGDLLRVLQEASDGQKVVKVYAGQQYETERFDLISNDLRGYAMRMATAQAIGSPFTQLIAGVAVAAVVGAAIYESTLGAMTAGQFSAFMTAMLMLIPPLKQLSDINAPLQRGIAAAQSVFELIDASPEHDSGTVKIAQSHGEIRFEHVSLRYAGAESDALHDINLHIRPGESVALVGPSGGGKTSLAHLIPRFYHATSGTVSVDGEPIDTLTLGSLRQQIALVGQDVVLFNDTIGANVAYGAQRISSREAIEAAITAAHLDSVIAGLPGGIDSQIGERGTRLSGGQRQRLAIARAILKEAPILILDEATSALDSESERHVQAALEGLMKDRTTIVIAHRLSTIENCDRVVVLEHGRITEQGTHDELMARNGVYARLYRIQYAFESTAG